MCEIWEEVRREGIAEGIELAKDEIEKANAAKAEASAAKAKAEASAAKAEAKERATKTALRMIKRGNLSIEEIAEYTGLTEEEVKEYKELIAG